MIILDFVSDDTISSKIIEWFCAGVIAHVDIVLPNGDLLGARSESVKLNAQDAIRFGVKRIPPGVQIRPPNYRKFTRIYRFHLNDSDIADNFIASAKLQIGKPYDWSAIFGFVFNRDWRSPKSWFCSEYVAYELEAKFMPKLFTPDNKVTPPVLATALSACINVTWEILEQ